MSRKGTSGCSALGVRTQSKSSYSALSARVRGVADRTRTLATTRVPRGNPRNAPLPTRTVQSAFVSRGKMIRTADFAMYFSESWSTWSAQILQPSVSVSFVRFAFVLSWVEISLAASPGSLR